MSFRHLIQAIKGGAGSGNWGHAGRPGSRGGSAPKTGIGAAMSIATGRTAVERQVAARQAGKLSPTEQKRVENAKRARENGYGAPQVLVMGFNPKEEAVRYGVPDDFYVWQPKGDMSVFGLRVETGTHVPNPKYLTPEYTKAMNEYHRLYKTGADFRIYNQYADKAQAEWRKIVASAQDQVIKG